MSSELTAVRLTAHSLSSLPFVLPVGLKRSIVLTGKENEEKERGEVGGGLSWLEWASIGRMPGR